MRQIVTILLVNFITVLFAQSTVKTDVNTTTQNIVVRVDKLPHNLSKSDTEQTNATNSTTSGNESVSYNATANGIYITILKGSNKIKLLAFTGQLLFNGDLTKGLFFIPTKRGIYILSINNKSFKVICK